MDIIRLILNKELEIGIYRRRGTRNIYFKEDSNDSVEFFKKELFCDVDADLGWKLADVYMKNKWANTRMESENICEKRKKPIKFLRVPSIHPCIEKHQDHFSIL